MSRIEDQEELAALAFLRRKIAEDGPPRDVSRGEPPISKALQWPCDPQRFYGLFGAKLEMHWRHVAHDVRALLARTMKDSCAPMEDRKFAAHLFLRGAHYGWWDTTLAERTMLKIAASNERTAKQPKPTTNGAPRVKAPMKGPQRPRSRDLRYRSNTEINHALRRELDALFAAVRAGQEMKAIIEHGNDSRKLKAISSFFNAVEAVELAREQVH